MDWQRLCTQLNLGELLGEPIPLTGGLMHKMFRMDTDKGCYAVKCLNPHVMARPDALGNFAAAEVLERKLEQTDLPILPALTIAGRKMQEMEGAYFYVFPYFAGAALTEGNITPAHCRKVGALLAGIHRIERRQESPALSPIAIDWDALLTTADEAAHALLAPHLPLLKELQERANRAMPNLPQEVCLCHNDMDPKNLLWKGEECRVIDLECLGYASPYLELMELALCWAGYETHDPDRERLVAFVDAYAESGVLPTDWETLYDANAGRLEWLAYNLRRAAGEEGNAAKALGFSEVEKTLDCLIRTHRIRRDVLNRLNDV